MGYESRRVAMPLIAALAGLMSIAAQAQDAAPFYAGKTVTISVGAGAGGSYDLYARALANHLGRHIPGEPQIVVKLGGGVGGGVATAIQVEHSAPRDGTVIGMVQQTNVTGQLTESAVAGKYDVSKWRWIGGMASLRNFLGVWFTAPAQSLEEAKTKEVIIGATGRNSPTYTVPAALNELLGTKFKMVLGYNGAADLNLAMERGEIQGRGASWISVVLQAPNYISDHKLKPLVVDGLTRDPLLPETPTLLELATTEEQKAAVRLISASAANAGSDRVASNAARKVATRSSGTPGGAKNARAKSAEAEISRTAAFCSSVVASSSRVGVSGNSGSRVSPSTTSGFSLWSEI